MSNLAKNLAVVRKKRGLSQRYLSNMLGLAPNAVQGMETGKTRLLGAETLYKLSKILKVSMKTLLIGPPTTRRSE